MNKGERNGSRMLRTSAANFSTREEQGDLFIEGYFAVFDEIYELWPGATESIARGAFDGCLSGDVRALTDHKSELVLGRTTAGTLTLFVDEHGLGGRIRINRGDSDAMNLYARVKRRDVTQCSFGFDIGEEKTEFREDGSVHWTITKVDPLYEVSVCTFPAYEATGVEARKKDFDAAQKRRAEVWRQERIERVKKAWH